jgi:hypothetical protein
MKKIILIITFILGCGMTQAQRLELGLHGGVGFNTVPKNSTDSVIPPSSSTVLSYVVSIKAFTNVGNWQVGAGIDLQKIARKTPATKYIFANPASPIYLLLNRRFFVTYKGYVYAGADIGLMFANSSDHAKFSNGNLATADVVYFEQGNGYTAGAHVGGTLNLSNRFDLTGEIGGKYTKYGYSYTHFDKYGTKTTGDDHYSYIYPSVTLGLRLKLFTDRFTQWAKEKEYQ